MINQNQIQRHLPGQRILKTSIAVTLCLLYYMLRGRQGETMPAEAAITAIICMQSDLHDTRKSGFSRLAGTVIGAVWGFLFLLLMALVPALGKNLLILYPLIGAGTLLALHSAVLFHRPDASGLAAIVFVCVVIAYPDIENPLDQAFHRILDVMLGTGIALLVNAVRLPRARQRNKVFFIPMDCLAENHLTQLSPPVLFQLQKLQQDGAKICLVSGHAPAFQTTQLGAVKFNVPMIVMDGAAIYDPNENVYTATTNMNPASCRWLMKRLDDQSYFIYTVHRDRNCIHHHGTLTEMEEKVYRHLKRSPYRYYLDDDHFSVSDVVYIKLVTDREHAGQLQRDLERFNEYYPLGKYAKFSRIPNAYQQALVMQWTQQHGSFEGMPWSIEPATCNLLTQFVNLYMKNQKDPSLSTPPLGNTFWSYMLVSQEGKEKKGKQQMKEIY